MRKKENVGFIYFVAFSFLALAIFGGLGFYNNSITGAATDPFSGSVEHLSNAMKGVMNILINGIAGPVFGYALSNDETAGFFLRIMIFLFLLFILQTVFNKNETFKKFSWALSGIIAFMSAAFFPGEILSQGQSLIGSIVVIGMVIAFIILAYKMEVPPFFKGFIFFILFLLILMFLGLIENSNWFYSSSVSLSMAVAIIAALYYFAKGLLGIGSSEGGSEGSSPGLIERGINAIKKRKELKEAFGVGRTKEGQNFLESIKRNTGVIEGLISAFINNKADLETILKKIKGILSAENNSLYKRKKKIIKSSSPEEKELMKDDLENLRKLNLGIMGQSSDNINYESTKVLLIKYLKDRRIYLNQIKAEEAQRTAQPQGIIAPPQQDRYRKENSNERAFEYFGRKIKENNENILNRINIIKQNINNKFDQEINKNIVLLNLSNIMEIASNENNLFREYKSNPKLNALFNLNEELKSYIASLTMKRLNELEQEGAENIGRDDKGGATIIKRLNNYYIQRITIINKRN